MFEHQVFVVEATIDTPPREYAQTQIRREVRAGRSLRTVVASLVADGYDVVATSPEGVAYPGSRMPPQSMMDSDLGYSPKPEFAHLMSLVEGAWILDESP